MINHKTNYSFFSIMAVGSIVITAMCSANEFNHEHKMIPVLFYTPKGDVQYPQIRGSALPVNKINEDFNNAVLSFQAMSHWSDIGINLSSDGWEILCLSRKEVYKDDNPISFVNGMNLNKDRALAAFRAYGKHVGALDLFTSNADSEAIASILKCLSRCRTLVMPFSHTYEINDVTIPDSVDSLVLYNQKISIKTLNSLSGLKNLKNLVLWGCVFEAGDPIIKLKEKIDLSILKDVTVINCDLALMKQFMHLHMPMLDKIETDSIDLVRLNKSVSEIYFYTQKFNLFNSSISDRRPYNEEVLKVIVRGFESKKIKINLYD